MREQGPLLTLLALCAAASIVFPDFRTWLNISNVLKQVSMIGLVSIGMTFVILSGGIDLSVGSTAAVAALLAVKLGGGSGPMTVLVPVFAGVCVGVVNGALVTRAAIPPFIATLATMLGVRGLAFIMSDGESIVVENTSGWFSQMARADILGVPLLAVIFITALIVAVITAKYTRFGRSVYAVGGSEEAARMMGLGVRRCKMAVYMIAGGCAGAAGVLLASRLNSAKPDAAGGWELAAIAAVVIGGTSLTGGIGKMSHTLYGVLILGVIPNIINKSEASLHSWYKEMITGILLLAVILLQSRATRRED
jgi:galactofuranose transport system permease protein